MTVSTGLLLPTAELLRTARAMTGTAMCSREGWGMVTVTAAVLAMVLMVTDGDGDSDGDVMASLGTVVTGRGTIKDRGVDGPWGRAAATSLRPTSTLWCSTRPFTVPSLCSGQGSRPLQPLRAAGWVSLC